jgi:hypothetical protein
LSRFDHLSAEIADFIIYGHNVLRGSRNLSIAGSCLGRRARRDKVAGTNARRSTMYLIIGLVLVLLWLGGFLMFHVASFAIHLLLIFAVISIIFHFLRGGSKSV